MIRILFLEHNTDGTVGGSHYCLLEICRAIDRTRFETVVWFHERHALVPEFVAAGCEVVIAPAMPVYSFAEQAKRVPLGRALAPVQRVVNAYRTLISNAAAWKLVLRERRIDIVHLNNSCTYDQDLALAAKRAGIPCIAHQRGLPGEVGRFERLVARRMNRVIAISSSVRDELQGAGIQSVLLFDAIDPARVTVAEPQSSLLEARGIPKGAPLIGIVGNVKRWKGQAVVVAAMRDIVRAVPDAHCLIIGAVAEANYQSELERDVERSGLGDRVHFLGYHRRPADVMALLDVVLHASITPEPFGIVLLEAMALSKPVIATDFGGPRDIVADGETGFLVPARDSTALAARVVELLRDPVRRSSMGDAGCRRLHSLFRISDQVRSLERLYLEVLSENR